MKKDVFRRAFAVALGALVVLSGVTCTDTGATGPGRYPAIVAINPTFSHQVQEIAGNLAAVSVTLDNIHITLDHSDGTIATDTVVVIPFGADSVVLDIHVGLNGSTEVLTATVEIRSGNSVMFSGTQKIVAKSGAFSDSPADSVPITFKGPGADATGLVVAPKDTALRSVDSVQFRALATDAQGAPVSTSLIVWSVKDAAVGSVGVNGMFKSAGPDIRGNTWVIGKLPTGVKDSAKIFVLPRVTTVRIVQGKTQNGTVGLALPQSIVAEARGVDLQGVPGATINFSVLAGGGSITPLTAIADAAGRASATFTLGATAGQNFALATTPGASGDSAVATGVAATPTKLIIQTQPSATTASGALLAQQPVVRVADANGNTITSSTAIVSALTTGGYTLGGTTSVAAVNGIATFTNVSLAGPAGTATIGFASGVLAKDSSNTTVIAGVANRLFVTSLPTASDTIDATLVPAFTPAVLVRDASANPAPNVAVTFVRHGAVGGKINGQDTIAIVSTDATGIAKLTSRRLSAVLGVDSVIATAAGVADTGRFVATATNGQAHHLVFSGQPANGSSNADLAVTVAAQDRLNNPIGLMPQPTVTLTIKPSTGDPAAVLSAGTGSALTKTTINGFAAFVIRIDKSAIGYQLIAAATGLTSGTSNAFSIGSGPAAGMLNVTSLIRIDTIDATITHVDTLPTVIVRDAQSQPVAGVQVKFRKRAGPNASLNGLPTSTDSVFVTTGSDGKAALTSWKMRTGWGIDSLYATSPALTDTILFSALVLSGKPTHMQFLSQPPTLVASNSPFVVALVLRDRLDSVSTNPTATSPVLATMAIKTGTGDNTATLSPVSPTTSLSQDATAGSGAWFLKIDKAATGYVLVASAAGLTLESNAFAVGGGTPSSLTLVSQFTPVDSIDASAAPIVVVVQDAIEQVVQGALVKFKRRGGNNGGLVNGVFDSVVVATNAGGVATVSRRARATVGLDTIDVTVVGSNDTARVVGQVTNGNPHHLVFSTQPSVPLAAGANFTWAVTVQDRVNNPATTVDGTNVAIGIKAGSTCTSLLPAPSTTAATVNGVASFAVHIDGTGAGCLLTATYVGVPTFDSNPFDIIPGVATQVGIVRSGQGALKGAVLEDSVIFYVRDNLGNGLPAITPTFTPLGGGSVSGPATTDGNGRIARQWTVGTSGVQQLTLTYGSANGTADAFLAETLVVSPQPEPTVSGALFPTQPKVQIRDKQGNDVKLANVSIAASILQVGFSCDCSPPSLSGTLTQTTDANGEAKWTDLAAIGSYGLNWKLRFKQTGTVTIDEAFSDVFSIQAGPAAGLVFSVQPPFAQPNQVFTVAVEAKDINNHLATSFTGPVTISLGNNPGSATLGGTLSVNAVAGVATFPDLSLNALGSGYTLLASSAPLDQITSTAFSIVNPLSFSLVAPAVYSNDHYHTCGLTPAGAPYCWGDNTYGAIGAMPNIGGDCVIGYPSTEYCPRPMAVSGAPALTSISSGDGFSCGLNASNQAYCWGSNGNGELGIGTGNYPSGPVLAANSMTLTQIIAGSYHACGIQAVTHLAYCWGYNGYMNLGNSLTDFSAQYLPVPVLGAHTFSKLAANYGETCGITTSSSIYCWGLNDAGQLGDTLTTDGSSGQPVKVSSDLSFTDLSVGASHVCAIDTGGDLYCWGRNVEGQLGDGSNSGSNKPVLSSNSSMVKVTAGYDHSCSIRSNQKAYCWGANDYGQLGDGTNVAKNTPTLVAGNLDWIWIAAGVQYTCGVTTGNVAYCWGSNGRAELGTGDFTNFNVPTQVGLPGSPGTCCALRAQPAPKKKG